jgi:phosphotriesterase-related protein
VKLQTVTGPIDVAEVTLADGHGHVWIDPPAGVVPGARLELRDEAAIRAELSDFRAASGSMIVDCQPGGCGRDGGMLARLAAATGVHIAAVTGFHRRVYYSPDSWLWSASETEAADYFVEELAVGMRETGGRLPATAVKVGYEGVIDGQSRVLMETAADAARRTGAAVLFHTERGKNVEALPAFFGDRGVSTGRLYFCHLDKRPDLNLHLDLARAGALLGYDTFVRPQYNPNTGAWPLVRAMVANGLTEHVAVGLDMAFKSMWRRYGGEPGLLALPAQILPRLRAEGIGAPAITQLVGGNVARFLALAVERRS